MDAEVRDAYKAYCLLLHNTSYAHYASYPQTTLHILRAHMSHHHTHKSHHHTHTTPSTPNDSTQEPQSETAGDAAQHAALLTLLLTP